MNRLISQYNECVPITFGGGYGEYYLSSYIRRTGLYTPVIFHRRQIWVMLVLCTKGLVL